MESEEAPEAVSKRRDLSVKREAAKQQFWNIIHEKWPLVRVECSKHWNNPGTKDDCQVEKSIIREHVEVFEHGVVMALAVFASLRLTAHPKFRPFAESYIKPFFRLTPKPKEVKPEKRVKIFSKQVEGLKSPKKMATSNIKEPTSAHKSSSQGRQFKSYLEEKRDKHVEKINKAAEAPHDFFVGTLVGFSATLFFLRPSQIRLDFEEAPLCPGRSFWSEQMCDNFIKIYQETDPTVFEFENTIDDNLRSFEKFTLNCMLRSEYIQRRKLAGEKKPLVLPEPGPWT